MAATLVLAAAICAAPDGVLAQDVETRPWSEILMVVGHDVALALPDGYVEGKALAVTPEALEMNVQKTSNADVYPKGHATIARSLVSVIRLRRSDGGAPRVATQTIGQAAVIAGFAGLASRNPVRSSLRSAGVQIGASTLGVAIGRRLDDRDVETLIRIAPEPENADSGSLPMVPGSAAGSTRSGRRPVQ
jgi:hypothetical protein